MSTFKNGCRHIYLTQELSNKVDAVAGIRKRSEFIRQAITEKLNKIDAPASRQKTGAKNAK